MAVLIVTRLCGPILGDLTTGRKIPWQRAMVTFYIVTSSAGRTAVTKSMGAIQFLSSGQRLVTGWSMRYSHDSLSESVNSTVLQGSMLILGANFEVVMESPMQQLLPLSILVVTLSGYLDQVLGLEQNSHWILH